MTDCPLECFKSDILWFSCRLLEYYRISVNGDSCFFLLISCQYQSWQIKNVKPVWFRFCGFSFEQYTLILILINRIQGKPKLKYSTHLERDEKKGMKEDLWFLLHNYFKVKIIRTSLPGMMLYLRYFKITWYKICTCLLTVCPHIYILFLIWLLWKISFVAQQLLIY